jgi:ubiquinone/menaquinone biosynthesis C-methylase UbiE
MKDLYEKFAYDYDEFGAISDYLGDEKAFFDNLFKRNNINTVLDCACGTGQHLYMFSEMGLNVNGSDYSKAMLEVANNNLKKYGKEIPLCHCDFRFLEQKYTNTFDAVVCLTTALPHLHADSDLITALKSMKNRLNKNGVLVLTQGTTHYNLT